MESLGRLKGQIWAVKVPRTRCLSDWSHLSSFIQTQIGMWILGQPASGDRGSEKPFRVDERSKPAKHTLFASSGDGNLHFGVLQLGSVLCPWQGNPAILVDALIRRP